MSSKVRILILVLAATMAPALPASAASCAHSGGVLTIDGSPGDPFIAVSNNAGTIEVYAGTGVLVPCGDPAAPPTVTNIDVVRIGGTIPEFFVFIDQLGGPFAPGLTAEPDGSSEIEFEIDLSASPDADLERESDSVVAFGTSGADTIVTGTTAPPLSQGMNLNAAEPVPDFDVTAIGAEIFGVSGLGGNDRVVGSAAASTEVFFGGAGNDRLSGGAGFDLLFGQSGNDRLSGGPSRDILVGGRGKDRCRGGPGKELVKGCE